MLVVGNRFFKDTEDGKTVSLILFTPAPGQVEVSEGRQIRFCLGRYFRLPQGCALSP